MGRWTEFLTVARQAAGEAGEMLKQGMSGGRIVSYKGELDLVTDFDRKAQDLIYGRLSSAYPDHGFLAEEGLNLTDHKEFIWVFDPLDGTTNFAHRFPVFTVSIALEFGGKIVLGLVYDPMRAEMFEAVNGEGALLNSRPIRVTSTDDLNKSLLATGFPYDLRTSRVNNISHFNNFLTRAQALRRCGSAAMDLSYVACGRFDGFWELKLKPWDHAAGSLIVKEAGGLVTDFDGETFGIYGQETLATNGLIHKAMIRVLKRRRSAEGRPS
jgi:myo-inositol-1(or 4)-monophosphatase